MKNLEDLRPLYPEALHKIVNIIISEGFIITLIGGSIRDLLTGSLDKKDLDFELRHQQDFSEIDWKEEVKRLSESIDSYDCFTVEQLSFLIFRVKYLDYDIEIAPARVEVFDDENSGHKNFVALYSPTFSYQEAFARRDFTINAMGIEFGLTEKWVDPFGGLKHFQDKLLYPCSDNFYRDPVRFLRAFRMKQKLQFKFSDQIFDQLRKMNLHKLSMFYFFKELFKSDSPILLWHEMADFIVKWNLETSEEFLRLLSFSSQLLPISHCDIKGREELVMLCFFELKDVGLAQSLGLEMGFPRKQLSEIAKLVENNSPLKARVEYFYQRSKAKWSDLVCLFAPDDIRKPLLALRQKVPK